MTTDLEREHALGMSHMFHHGCETKDVETFAAPDTNGRLRCLECGAFCKTSGGSTHVEPHPIAYSERTELEAEPEAIV